MLARKRDLNLCLGHEFLYLKRAVVSFHTNIACLVSDKTLSIGSVNLNQLSEELWAERVEAIIKIIFKQSETLSSDSVY